VNRFAVLVCAAKLVPYFNTPHQRATNVNHPSKNMASLAELVGADDEAAVLCAALAKAITRLEKKRDEYDRTALQVATVANEGHAARVEHLNTLHAEVTTLGETTARAVKERDTVIQALRSLVGEAEQVSDSDMNSEQAERWEKYLTQAKELLTIIDQTTAARGEKKLGEQPAGDQVEQPAGDQVEQPAGDQVEQKPAGDQVEQPGPG
jgi:ABC-type transporter Mla subunit MlaD